jgi:adenylate cyclase
VERRLVAVLSADVVGYSRLMSRDDAGTVRTLQAHQRRIEGLIGTFRGRLVDAPGDNLLAEFPSALGSVRCALEIQRALADENAKVEPERRMALRIGIHLGDVVVEGARIFGDGVNIAARLEGLAEAGGVCISDLVYQQVRRRLSLAVTDLGEQRLKNIELPVRVYRVGAGTPASAAPRAAEPVELAPPDKPSLAVLPFVNMSGDPAQDYWSDGLTHDILEALVKLPGLFLIGYDSVFRYKSTGASPSEVARELGVRHVLEGTVRKAGARVRVTAHLCEAASGRHVWAGRYDHDLEDAFRAQDEVTDAVVTSLDVALVGGETARVVRRGLRNPRALELVYRGLELLHRFTRDDNAKARALFEELVELEPACSFGYSDSAWTHYFDLERGWTRDPEASLARMSERAGQALQRGDESGHALLMLAHRYLIERRHDEALETSALALAERPNCQAAYSLEANILNYCSRPEEAIPLAMQAIRQSPVAPPWFPEVLATAYYLCRRYEEAMSAAHQALAHAPDDVNARLVLTASLVQTGRVEAAREAAQEVRAVDPDFTLERFARVQPYRDAGTLARLVETLAQAGLPAGDGGPPLSATGFSQAPARRRVAPRPRR